MVTIYDLLEVDENASKEEIEKSYQKLVIEYQTNPILTEEENKKNELILNKLKMAFEILMSDEKRKKYDKDLSKKRAEELIKNIPERKQEEKQIIDSDNDSIRANSQIIENNSLNGKTEQYLSLKDTKKNNFTTNNKNQTFNNGINNSNDTDRESIEEINVNYDEIPKARNTRYKSNEQDENVELSKEEQKKIRKAAQKEFNENLKKVQKVEEEYNNAYNEAYKKYMKKMGYETKEPWTLKRLKNVLIAIITIILVCSIAWIIPPIRKVLINIYENNIIIKSFFDIIGVLLKGILSIFE